VFFLYFIFRVIYNHFVLHERGFAQVPSVPFSSSISAGGIFDFFHDTCDRMGFTRDRWAGDHNWQGFSRGGGTGFERFPTDHDEAQTMLGSDSLEEDDEEDPETETPGPKPAGMDSQGIIRL